MKETRDGKTRRSPPHFKAACHCDLPWKTHMKSVLTPPYYVDSGVSMFSVTFATTQDHNG